MLWGFHTHGKYFPFQPKIFLKHIAFWRKRGIMALKEGEMLKNPVGRPKIMDDAEFLRRVTPLLMCGADLDALVNITGLSKTSVRRFLRRVGARRVGWMWELGGD